MQNDGLHDSYCAGTGTAAVVMFVVGWAKSKILQPVHISSKTQKVDSLNIRVYDPMFHILPGVWT